MGIISKYVKVRWNNTTKSYYESLGYTFTKAHDEFYVKVSDLMDGSGVKILASCDSCNKEIYVAYCDYENYYKKNDGKYYCHNCCNKNSKNKPVLDRKEIIRRVESKNGDRLLNPEDYINIKTSNLKIKCGSCGETFITSLASICASKGMCKTCALESQRKNSRHKVSEILQIAQERGIEILNPEDYIDSATTNLQVVCNNCGAVYTTYLYRIIDGQQFCQKCRKALSVGEEKIQVFLNKNDIIYEKEKWYEDCKDIKPLPFDFYLPDYNTLIEFDGQHHFEPTFGEKNLLATQKHDEMKDEYCKKNNIRLIRIPYWEGSKIDEIIKRELNIA